MEILSTPLHVEMSNNGPFDNKAPWTECLRHHETDIEYPYICICGYECTLAMFAVHIITTIQQYTS